MAAMHVSELPFYTGDDTGDDIPQGSNKALQPALPRQDSLDSSEWECLSHEQYLAEANH